MKRFTLILLATLMVMANAMAQPKGKVQSNAKIVAKTTEVKAPARPVIKLADVKTNTGKQSRQLAKVQQQSADKKTAGKSNLQPRKRVAASKAQRRAAGIITDQPEGVYHCMLYSTSYYGYNWLVGLYYGSYTEALGEVVEGNDGCLYIHNMLTEMSTEEGYWVKAEKVEGEADTYVIHKQPIYVEEYYGETYTYYIMKATLDNGTMVPANSTDIKLTWKDGTLRTAAEFNNSYSQSAVISAFDNEDYWSGAMNWNVKMTPQTDVAITELPTGVEPEEMVMKYISGYTEYYENEDAEEPVQEPVYEAQKVKMAVSGNDIYLQYYTGIDSWIKGTINGDKASFPNYQYLGPDHDYGQHTYFIGATESYDMPENVVFDYDATNKKLSTSEYDIYANGGKSEIYYMAVYTNPEIFKFVETAAKPQPVPAESFYAMNYNRRYGYGFMDFDIPYFDVDGNYMNTDKLFYKVYVGDDDNNTAFTFTPEEYISLEAPMTEIPFGFKGVDFWSNGKSHEFTHYVNKPKNFGIQVIYKGGGQENASEISWYWQNNGAAGYESVFPQVENPVVNSQLADGEVALNLGEASYSFGSGCEATETFDVAMKVADGYDSKAKLAGKKIVGISIPFTSIEGISNAKAWLSTSIETDENGKFTPNGPVKEFTLSDNGYTTVKFDQPYEIPEEDGIFIGYTFTQAYDDEAVVAPTPIVLTNTTNIGGFMVHSDKVYRLGWASMEGVEGDLAVEAILTGCDADAAEFKGLKDTYVTAGETSQTTAIVANYGCKELQSIDYNYKMLGYDEANEKEITLTGNGSISNMNMPRVFGGIKTFTIDVPATQTTTDFVFYADATKANNQPNTLFNSEVPEDEYNAQAQCNVYVMNFVPKKRALMEEYTGTWCGWCPRGFVGLEKMSELYPEDFIALSYHNTDPMEVTKEFPSDVQGFPSAFLDRKQEVDAYSGTAEDGFAIDKAWLEHNLEFGYADINVEAAWTDDQKTINVKATAKFARSEEYADYRLAYAVVADGLTGTSDDWAQTNYYAEGAYGYPEYMDVFTMGESHVTGLVFNDVLVASSPYDGVEASLPEAIEEGKEYTHEYSFKAADIVNTEGMPVIQNNGKVKVVAILVSSWGEVYNANRCKVTNASAIGDIIKSNNGAESVEYYDLSGRKIAAPAKGMYIKSVRSNGKTVNEKVLMK